jgi:Flp pilus assembly CpaF family ATPase
MQSKEKNPAQIITLISETFDFIPTLKARYAGLSDIMLTTEGALWVKHKGKLLNTGIMLSAEQAELGLRALASYNNAPPLNYQYACLSAVIPPELGGGRLEGHLPPIAKAPEFTIRIPRCRQTLKELESARIITNSQKHLILNLLNNHLNIIIAGGTGSGKTTLLSALVSEFIDDKNPQRLFIIEDTPEIDYSATHPVNICALNTTPYFDWWDAVKSALRSVPDRIILGEVRDGATAAEMLKAWNTGHRGGLATLHANSACAAGDRLMELLREKIASPSVSMLNAVDAVIYMEAFEGRPTVKEILCPFRYGSNSAVGGSK